MAIRPRQRFPLFGNPLMVRQRVKGQRQMRGRGWRSFWRRPAREKWRLIVRWLGYGAIGGLLFVLLLFAFYAKDLPNPNTISSRQVDQSTKVLDRNGNLLYEIFKDGKRTLITADEMSPHIKQATVAVEDSDFYQHHGVDFLSIMRAVYSNITGRSRYTQGGSTITQQYIKNALLTSEKRLSRKIKEAILAVEIETIYDKDEILAGYLNEIPYGNNTFGVESAARTYFNKSARDLTLSESAVLAAIPQRPSYFSPYGTNLDELFARKDFVLDEMQRHGFITEEEAAAAKEAAPTAATPGFAEQDTNIKAPHFVFYVRDELVELFGGDQEAEQELATGGYTVTTTLDYDVQKLAEEAIAEQTPRIFERYNASNSAAVAIDPASGDILAMVGSVDFFNKEFGSVNVAARPRQPGSSFKPVVYATGFKGKFSPASVLFDLRTDFGGGYIPNNYDGGFRGPVTVRQALAWSLNIPAVKMLDLVGLDNALKTAADLGISTLTDRDSYGLSLVLGAGEVKLVELTHAYSVFANGGTKMPLTAIMKVEKAGGEVLIDITDKERRGEEVMDPAAAFLISDVLADTATKIPVFGNALTISGHSVASKTGTTQSFRDGWTIGYTPQIAFGVWTGNNDNTEMRRGADGVVVAAPIWRTFMTRYLSDKQNIPFTAPKGVGREVVDKLSTKLPAPGCSTELIEDWFASWHRPTEQDNVHNLVKIDRISGKLATELTPTEYIEERCYRNLHSERPNRPNWEGPVVAWAQANGYNTGETPPTESDDVHTEANRPTVSITVPLNNQEVTPNVAVSATIGSIYPLVSVQFLVDGESRATMTASPYNTTLTNLSIGERALTVRALDSVGNVGESSITLIVSDSGSNWPGTVSNVTAKATGSNVEISWKNPSDSNLVSVRVYESSQSGTLGPLVRTVAAASGSNSGTTFSNHPAGTFYYTLRPTNSAGNENPTVAQYIVTVPNPN